MLAASAMFAACFESCYRANYSPFKIVIEKIRKTLQVPAGVMLCVGRIWALNLDQAQRTVVIMWAMPVENGSLPPGGHWAHEHTNPKLAEKNFQDLHSLRYTIISEVGRRLIIEVSSVNYES